MNERWLTVAGVLLAGGTLAMLAGGVLAAPAAKTTRCGAKVVKTDLALAGREPEVRVLEAPERWRLLKGERYTGMNAREYFFTLEADGEAPPPRVEVIWPGVGIARVLGAVGDPEPVKDGLAFRMRRGGPPTGVRTSLQEGLINLCIFHNWDVRRAGDYRSGPWPADAIQAQLNYLFAAREMCRAMGYDKTTDSGFTGDIRLYGFETNFPNGHADSPPHFHIMLAWPGWLNTQVTHFRLDDVGRITINDFQTDDGKRVTGRKYAPGEVCKMLDPEARVGFELIVAEGGHGVVMRKAPRQPEFRLSPDSRSKSPVDAVEVNRRDSPDAPWRLLCRVRATDDAEHGEVRVTVRPADGEERAEVIRYDPDTGVLRK